MDELRQIKVNVSENVIYDVKRCLQYLIRSDGSEFMTINLYRVECGLDVNVRFSASVNVSQDPESVKQSPVWSSRDRSHVVVFALNMV